MTGMSASHPIAPLFPAAILGIALASGCSTAVQQSYKESPGLPGAALMPYSGSTHVYGSYNLDSDAAALAKKGYVQIGASSFRTTRHVTYNELQDQAQRVGADIILFLKVDARTNRPVDPVAANNDGTPHAFDSTDYVGSIKALGGNRGGNLSPGSENVEFNGKIVSSGVPGVTTEDMAEMNAPEFDYSFTYWRKSKAVTGS